MLINDIIYGSNNNIKKQIKNREKAEKFTPYEWQTIFGGR